MAGFRTPVDIANRGLQHCGASRMDPTLGFAEISKNAAETSACYDGLRRAELRRNIWVFATRIAVLRPLDTNTMFVAPAMWESGVTYFLGSIVSDENEQLWISQIPNNLGNQPELSLTWAEYFGPMTVSLYDSTTTYFAGELVYTAAGDGTYNTYLSLVSNNVLHPALPNEWTADTTYTYNQVVQVYPAWAVGTTYAAGATVTYTDGNTYASMVNGNVGNIPPSSGANWALVPTLTLAAPTGSPTTPPATPYTTSPVIEWSRVTTYSAGSFVMFNGKEYLAIALSTGQVPSAAASIYWVALSGGTLYMSLIELNVGNSPTSSPAPWASGTSYSIGNQVAGSDGVIYTSVTNANLNHDPTTDSGANWTNTGTLAQWTTVFTQGGGNQQWMQVGGAAFPAGVTLTAPNIIWPIGAGPYSQAGTRNVYRLPANWLREAPQAPKAGSNSWLGAPSGLSYNDWTYQGNYFVSSMGKAIPYRFVADTVDVTTFDDMFCEGLAGRIGEEVCETLTQSTEKLSNCTRAYEKAIGDARAVDGIETGAIEAAEDDWISCRL